MNITVRRNRTIEWQTRGELVADHKLIKETRNKGVSYGTHNRQY
jgi:hypothetical protein